MRRERRDPGRCRVGPGREEVEAARLLLARLGVSPADLLGPAAPRRAVPTFAAYVPVVAEGVGAGTRRVYGSYWNRIVEAWGERRLDEPTPSDVARLVEHVRTHVVARRNARGGCRPPAGLCPTRRLAEINHVARPPATTGPGRPDSAPAHRDRLPPRRRPGVAAPPTWTPTSA